MSDTVEYRNQVHSIRRERGTLWEISGLAAGYEQVDDATMDEHIEDVYLNIAGRLEIHDATITEQEIARCGDNPRKMHGMYLEAELDEDHEFWAQIVSADERDPVGMSKRPDRLKVRFGIDGDDPVHAELYEDMTAYIDDLDDRFDEMVTYKRFDQPQGWGPW